jgi:hypothetical protein
MNTEPKKTMPFVPVGHPDFKWTSGADVQATWRKYGWTPPSEGRPAPPPPSPMEETLPFAPFLRRFK